MDPLETLWRNRATAGTFTANVSKLDPQWHKQIDRQIGDLHAEPYASANARVDDLKTLAGRGPSRHIGEFLVTAAAELERANLPEPVRELAFDVVRAILVRNVENGERVLRLLYQPFKDYVPLDPVTPSVRAG